MNINYLILAHTNFNLIDQIIEELNAKNVSFYIHIDKKIKENYYNSLTNVFCLNNRYKINWGSFSMVEASLELLKVAYSNNKNNNARYILLSGSDFPIRPNEFIYKILNSDSEYINILPTPLKGKPMRRFRYYYLNYTRNKITLKSILFFSIEFLLQLFLIRRKVPFKIFVGSQWFALTNNCVQYILDEIKEKPQIINYFKYCYTPDEAFFHTIIGNSELHKKCAPNLTYTNWSSIFSPDFINEEHLKLLNKQVDFYGIYGKQTPLFARKFNNSNAYLIEQIKNTLRLKLPSEINN